MLQGVLSEIVGDSAAVVQRTKGVAFLFAARSIYQLSEIAYLCINIPRVTSGSFVHCAFTGDMASQAITAKPISMERLADLEVVKACSRDRIRPSAIAGGINALQLNARRSEFAVLGFERQLNSDCAEDSDSADPKELKILGDYFHSHMLRRNGVDTSDALVVSARELDCLRWVAAGKSAWEASVILGISERTVRFHLNSAREKLNCTTTTQAVAKVVARQLIAV